MKLRVLMAAGMAGTVTRHCLSSPLTPGTV